MQQLPSPVLILGARSDIARAIAHRYARAGCDLILAARAVDRLEPDRADIALRHGVTVDLAEFDVLSSEPNRFFASLGVVPGTIIMVVGLPGDQNISAVDDAAAKLVMDTNYAGPARVLLAAARTLRQRRDGCIIGISSVAGDRGRGSNYVYGSAKAGFTAFLSGLRNSLASEGIHVMTVKPGYVATAKTEGLALPPLLTARPEQVAGDIFRAQSRGRNVIYSRPFWRWIMAVIGSIPESFFKRLSL